MALFPLTSNFEEDFVLQLLPVDTEHTMDEVAAAAAHHSGLRSPRASVGPQPDPGIAPERGQGGRWPCRFLTHGTDRVSLRRAIFGETERTAAGQL